MCTLLLIKSSSKTLSALWFPFISQTAFPDPVFHSTDYYPSGLVLLAFAFKQIEWLFLFLFISSSRQHFNLAWSSLSGSTMCCVGMRIVFSVCFFLRPVLILLFSVSLFTYPCIFMPPPLPAGVPSVLRDSMFCIRGHPPTPSDLLSCLLHPRYVLNWLSLFGVYSF